MSEISPGTADHQRGIEVQRDGFTLVLQPQANPALVVMSMRMANGSLNELAEILLNPRTRTVIRHEVCGHGRESPPFRIGVWVNSVMPLLSQLIPSQSGSTPTRLDSPTTGDLDPPSRLSSSSAA